MGVKTLPPQRAQSSSDILFRVAEMSEAARVEFKIRDGSGNGDQRQRRWVRD